MAWRPAIRKIFTIGLSYYIAANLVLHSCVTQLYFCDILFLSKMSIKYFVCDIRTYEIIRKGLCACVHSETWNELYK